MMSAINQGFCLIPFCKLVVQGKTKRMNEERKEHKEFNTIISHSLALKGRIGRLLGEDIG